MNEALLDWLGRVEEKLDVLVGLLAPEDCEELGCTGLVSCLAARHRFECEVLRCSVIQHVSVFPRDEEAA